MATVSSFYKRSSAVGQCCLIILLLYLSINNGRDSLPNLNNRNYEIRCWGGVPGAPCLPALVMESCGRVGVGPVEESIFLERTTHNRWSIKTETVLTPLSRITLVVVWHTPSSSLLHNARIVTEEMLHNFIGVSEIM